LDDILGQTPLPGHADIQLVGELLAAIGEEPASVEEAFTNKNWHQAMIDELESIKENKT
jgi:hypothetical protein